MKITWLTFTVIIFLLSIVCNAQQKDFVIDKTKPSVYLSFERFGTYQSPCNEPESSGIWLRLNNNTRSTIFVDGVPVKEKSTDIISLKLSDNSEVRGFKNGTEIRLRYDWEAVLVAGPKIGKDGGIMFDIPVEVPLPKQLIYCSQKWMGSERGFGIAPGNSVLFSVPKDPLTYYIKVNVQYSYEWEGDGRFIKNFEPYHLIYFYGSQLSTSNESPKNDSRK
jgi:hypothetical protein